MSDSDIPKPPPSSDDFSKTTPNIDKADWGKTNYNYPAQPPADDWGNTVANVRHDDLDFGKTFIPGSENPKTPDWGITQGNIRLPNDDFGSKPSGGHDDANYGATTPYFRLPETERAKYQNIPLTPTQQEAAKEEEEKKKGGIPPWVWVSGGLFSMFLFAVLVLLIVYIFVIRTSGYEVVVKDAPLGSSIHVDGSFWAQTQPDGTYILRNLKAGEKKKVEIVHPNWVCQPETIDGSSTAPIRAKCKQVANISNECINIKAGAYEVAEKCANKALDELSENFSVDDLLRAMNLYIIQFAVNKYDIPDRNKVFLERASGFMKKLPPNVVVEVGGHTDSDGSNAANQTLSENRAKAVREALITFGVKPEMLTEKGYGEDKPKATNDTDDGKFQNRRIEYTAVKK